MDTSVLSNFQVNLKKLEGKKTEIIIKNELLCFKCLTFTDFNDTILGLHHVYSDKSKHSYITIKILEKFRNHLLKKEKNHITIELLSQSINKFLLKEHEIKNRLEFITENGELHIIHESFLSQTSTIISVNNSIEFINQFLCELKNILVEKKEIANL